MSLAIDLDWSIAKNCLGFAWWIVTSFLDVVGDFKVTWGLDFCLKFRNFLLICLAIVYFKKINER